MSFSMVGRCLLYFNTIRYLKPSQVFWRLWQRLPVFPARDAPPAPALRRSDQPLAAYPRKKSSLTGPDTFRFLNQEGRVQSATDWNDRQAEALWLYNLHYFDDLCADGAEARHAWHEVLIGRWIAENPVGQSAGWDPYPLSLRVVNWINWAISRSTPAPAAPPLLGEEGNGMSAVFLGSLAIQARWLARRVEWHLLGNHVLANAKALVYAGCFFDGAEAQAWRAKGVSILRKQLAEQVLADGGHFERSPMYHAIVLEDVLDLMNLSRCYSGQLPDGFVQMLHEVAQRMRAWAMAMTHPDGGIAFFNDAAFGIAPAVAELERYADRLGVAIPRSAGEHVTSLRESGYVRLTDGPYTVIFDAAPVGPDYLPGHAHADTLSFELSVGAQRVICNSGTSRYGRSELRHWERSTAAHNTVEIDGENSSEVWDGFRVARRAYPVGMSIGSSSAACAHDGYTRLPGRPVHRRVIEVSGNGVAWSDEIGGKGRHRAIGRIPLHPSVRAERAERVSGAAWRLTLASGDFVSLSVQGEGVTLGEEPGNYSPEFGITMDRQVLVWSVEGALPISVSLRLAG